MFAVWISLAQWSEQTLHDTALTAGITLIIVVTFLFFARGIWVVNVSRKSFMPSRKALKHDLVQDIGLQRACQPPRRLSFRWPLAIDIIVEAFNADKQGHILDFFLKCVSRTGNTFEQRILGARGIDTQDPQNIEAILSTQFNGMPIDPAATFISISRLPQILALEHASRTFAHY